MATGIPWVDETINPIIGCSKQSTGCAACYAEGMARRLAAMGTEGYKDVVTDGKWNGKTVFVPSALQKAYGWMKPRSIFVGSMGDLFHESVPFEWIDQIMRLAWVKKDHTFIMLTKRAARMHEYFHGLRQPGNQTDTAKRLLENPNYAQDSHGWHMTYLKGGCLPNLVLGVSVENQAVADERIPLLIKTPANRIFISIEPMVGPVVLPGCIECKGAGGYVGDSMGYCSCPTCDGSPYLHLDGVILGGESGSSARYLTPKWVRAVRDQCAAAEVPFMFKQGSAVNGNKASHWIEERDGFPVIDGEIHAELAWTVRKGRNVNIEVPHVGI